MYLTIIFLPLIGCFFSGFFGRLLSPKGSAFMTVLFVFLSFCFSLVGVFEIGLSHCPTYIKFYPWFDSGMFDATWGFLFDSLTISMCVTVTLISTLVHFYSTGYMGHDPHQPRFMAYLSLFTFSMLMLIAADNLLQLFFGWESVGLCSYLLINFWFTRLQANKAATKAMVVNRMGDFGLALGIFLVYITFKTVDYSVIFSLVHYYNTKTIFLLNFELDVLTTICMLLFIGAMGKSAQIGLHTWLPDAMEGPTPVSALIHAATMVTAGVFLLIRCSFIYETSYKALLIVCIVGCLTAFFAAITGVLQNDLKKVIAYSTCSQLGYMIFSCGLSNYSVSMFHLMNHAYFKALLFLSAGAVIHALADEQDLRKMGGLLQVLPFSYIMIMIGSLALMGFPFLTGFYSKDVILELAYSNYNFSGIFAFWLGLFSAGLTSFYSFRLIYLTFLANPNGFKSSVENIHEAPLALGLPLFLLGILSLLAGYLTKDLFIGIGTPYWNNSIFTMPEHAVIIESEFISLFIKWLPFFVSITSASCAFFLYFYGLSLLTALYKTEIGYICYLFFNRKFFFDKIQNEIVCTPLLRIGYQTTYKIIDKGFIELCGPSGISKTLLEFSQSSKKIQSGLLNHYASFMFIALILLISIVVLFSVLAFYFDIHIIFILIFTWFFLLI
uniref:NADH-ubiquinone oxidoreductase chain 5 n=1 Tax=Chroomonas placoidea TaxID=173977 RepID=A0A2P1G872_9CRYP|nr:NADH dehydrogenase subunit 5 [Chroomonas placoidea]AVM81086.1 NADH dehydrogenase subunit 5 [Chroomonas placoidea]